MYNRVYMQTLRVEGLTFEDTHGLGLLLMNSQSIDW